ncbi:MAG: endonuclease III [Thermoleophilia bacterium]|nr:endonuclease III [Thermoleophilia bacterium]
MESQEERKARVLEIIARLRGQYPNARIALNFGNEWELLVAVILSAQCTDKKVNEVTASLFKKYPTIEDFAAADLAELEMDIRPTGFYRNKAKHIKEAAQKILVDYGGRVPASMAELLTLPGVARKTANIVLGNAYPEAYARDPDAGIAVDTHVARLSQRLGLVDTAAAEKIERQLLEIVPREDWFEFTYLLIDHGRAVCDAKRPRCAECVLVDLCPSAFTGAPRN